MLGIIVEHDCSSKSTRVAGAALVWVQLGLLESSGLLLV